MHFKINPFSFLLSAAMNYVLLCLSLKSLLSTDKQTEPILKLGSRTDSLDKSDPSKDKNDTTEPLCNRTNMKMYNVSTYPKRNNIQKKIALYKGTSS